MILLAMTCAFVIADPVTHDVSITGPKNWTFDARLLEPSGERSGITVLLIGGGIGNDLDWSVPGTMEVDGTTVSMTIDGKTHRDAPLIAQALADKGHAVMHYTTIANEDPKKDLWPLEITPHSVTDLLLLQKAATSTIKSHHITRDDRLILLGHSMGAQRACAQAAKDTAIQGLVLIGAAQMTRTGPGDPGRNLNRPEAQARIIQLDADGNGSVIGTEIPDAMDLDQDGTLRVWEISATLAKAARRDLSPDETMDGQGIPFGEDSLKARPIPTLILYGNLDDAQGHHAPILQELSTNGSLESIEIRILPDIGHQLGPERDNRFGPISMAAIEQIVEWVERQKTEASP